jgi:nitrogen fixation NifU-like protein
MPSERLLDHFQNPRHTGPVPGATAVVEVTNPVCGDILKLWLRVEAGRIAQAGFKCRGCVASMACGSALAEMITGLPADEAERIGATEIEAAVDGLEAASKHAAALAADALREALSAARPAP